MEWLMHYHATISPFFCRHCRVQPNHQPTSPETGHHHAGQLYRQGLAQSTQRAYVPGKRCYLNFCERLGVSTTSHRRPAVGFLKDQSLRHQTVKSYLSAVHHLLISQGKEAQKWGQAKTVTGDPRDIKGQAGLLKKTRIPITPPVLRQIRQKWESHGAE